MQRSCISMHQWIRPRGVSTTCQPSAITRQAIEADFSFHKSKAKLGSKFEDRANGSDPRKRNKKTSDLRLSLIDPRLELGMNKLEPDMWKRGKNALANRFNL